MEGVFSGSMIEIDLAGATIVSAKAFGTIGDSLGVVVVLAARDGGALATSLGLWRFDAAGLLLGVAAWSGAPGETGGAELKKGRLNQSALAVLLPASRRHAAKPIQREWRFTNGRGRRRSSQLSEYNFTVVSKENLATKPSHTVLNNEAVCRMPE